MKVLKITLTAVLAVVALAALAVGGIFVYMNTAERPEDMTEARVFAGDGAAVDYCDLPSLDGSGLTADDIPVAHTPDCGWTEWPMPVLAECTEPLPPGAPDLRGLWLSDVSGHLERVEQCGDRVVVTSGTVIHDMRADGSLRRGANDVAGGCRRIRNTTLYKDGVLAMYPFGVPIPLVERWMDGEELRWTHPLMGEHRMRRICEVPADRR